MKHLLGNLRLISACFFVAIALLCFALSPKPAYAIDAYEAFPASATRLEFSFSFQGLGKDKYEKRLISELLLGYGIVKGFSFWGKLGFRANEYFGARGAHAGIGALGTPVDTKYFDLDLALDFDYLNKRISSRTASGNAVSLTSDIYRLAPWLEMNFDFDSDLDFFGFYLRAKEWLSGEDKLIDEQKSPDKQEGDEINAGSRFQPTTLLEAGAYWNWKRTIFLLLEYQAMLEHFGENDFASNMAFGVNYFVHEGVELLFDVRVHMPENIDGDIHADLGFAVKLDFPLYIRPKARLPKDADTIIPKPKDGWWRKPQPFGELSKEDIKKKSRRIYRSLQKQIDEADGDAERVLTIGEYRLYLMLKKLYGPLPDVDLSKKGNEKLEIERVEEFIEQQVKKRHHDQGEERTGEKRQDATEDKAIEEGESSDSGEPAEAESSK